MVDRAQEGSGSRQVDTEDRIMQKVAEVTAWAQENSRVATLSLLVLAAGAAAGVVYMNYRADLERQAAVRLDEIRLSARGAPPAQMRSELRTYVDQFGSTPRVAEARLMLAEMELERDSAAAAIALVEPIVDLEGGPLGYNAGWIRAVAEEQSGDLEAAATWYERLVEAAPHDFQRRRARAARARLHEYAGEYGAAEEIYADLAALESDAADSEFYAVKLGEVRARMAMDAPPPSVPEALGRPADGAASGDASGGAMPVAPDEAAAGEDPVDPGS